MDWGPILDIALRIAAVLALVLLNGFFVAAEFALVKVRDTQLGPLVKRGHRRARVAETILGRLDSFLSAAQLGITLASLGLGWIGEPVFVALLKPVFGWMHIHSAETQHVLAFVIASRRSPSCTSARASRHPSGWPSKNRYPQPCGWPSRCSGFTASPIRLWWS
jgi:hypothetical protein